MLQIFRRKSGMIVGGSIGVFVFYSLRRIAMAAVIKQQHTWLSKKKLLDLFNKVSRYGIIDLLASTYYGGQA